MVKQCPAFICSGRATVSDPPSLPWSRDFDDIVAVQAEKYSKNLVVESLYKRGILFFTDTLYLPGEGAVLQVHVKYDSADRVARGVQTLSCLIMKRKKFI